MLDVVPGQRPQRLGRVGRIAATKPAVRAAKQLVLKAVKEKCTPAATLSDNDFANKVLASKENQTYVREATLAKSVITRRTTRRRSTRLPARRSDRACDAASRPPAAQIKIPVSYATGRYFLTSSWPRGCVRPRAGQQIFGIIRSHAACCRPALRLFRQPADDPHRHHIHRVLNRRNGRNTRQL